VNQADGGDGDYGNKAFPLDGVTIAGPGSGQNSVGLFLHDNHQLLRGLTIHDAKIGLDLDSYSFSEKLEGVSIYDTTWPVVCGESPDNTDSGEQIDFIGGALFNPTYGIYNLGCEIHLKGTAIDYLTDEPFINTGTASTTMEDGHIDVAGLSGSFIDNATYLDWPGTGGCNGFTYVSIHDSRCSIVF
jgi:hypothetical protein